MRISRFVKIIKAKFRQMSFFVGFFLKILLLCYFSITNMTVCGGSENFFKYSHSRFGDQSKSTLQPNAKCFLRKTNTPEDRA